MALQPGSAFAGVCSDASLESSRVAFSTTLTQGHQSRCWELGSKKLLVEVSCREKGRMRFRTGEVE